MTIKTDQEEAATGQLTDTQEKLLNNVYYIQKVYTGRTRLYAYMKQHYPDANLTRRQIMRWLREQDVWQKTKQPERRQPSGTFQHVTSFRDFTTDLTGPLPSDKGFTYIFGLTQTASRRLFVVPIKDKTGPTVVNAFRKVIEEYELDVSILRHDLGTEFVGQEMKSFCSERGIKQISTRGATPWLSSAIERRWLDLKRMITKDNLHTGNQRWVDSLQRFVDNMNNLVNREIGDTPMAATSMPLELLKARLKRDGKVNNIRKPKTSFQVGNVVRIVLQANRFQKRKQTFSTELYIVTKVIHETESKIVTYKVRPIDSSEEIAGTYNATEMLLVPQPNRIYMDVSADDYADGPIRLIDQREVRDLNDNTVEVPSMRSSRHPDPVPGTEDEYEIESIIDRRRFGKIWKYKVRYRGYGAEADTWEKARDIKAPGLMQNFKLKLTEKTRRRQR